MLTDAAKICENEQRSRYRIDEPGVRKALPKLSEEVMLSVAASNARNRPVENLANGNREPLDDVLEVVFTLTERLCVNNDALRNSHSSFDTLLK